MTEGICRTPDCVNAVSGRRVDRYPGPGEYCPECGETLESAPPASAAAAPPIATVVSDPAPASQPFGGLTPMQALQQLDVSQSETSSPADTSKPSRTPRRIAIAVAAVAIVGTGAVFAFHPAATGRTAVAEVVHVCRSSMTQRFGADVVAEYARTSGTAASRFDLDGSAGCDVRFAVIPSSGQDVLGRDGIVAIVNPQNRIRSLTRAQLRGIFTGTITNWKQVGGRPGVITPLLTRQGSDEARTLSFSLLPAADVASDVRRLASGTDVVRTIVGGTGRNAIGLVAFSAAVPAKVISISARPAPSTLSIGSARYPLTVALIVEQLGGRRAAADGLVRFSRSAAAQAIVARDGFVPKEGV